MGEVTENMESQNGKINNRLNDEPAGWTNAHTVQGSLEKTREQEASEAFEEAKKQVQQEKKKPVENPAHIPGLPTLEEMRETLGKIAMEEKTMPKPEIHTLDMSVEKLRQDLGKGILMDKVTTTEVKVEEEKIVLTPANHTLEQVIAIGKAKMEETVASKPVPTPRSAVKVGKPKASTAAIVELYKEKINLIEYLESIVVPDSGIEALSKAGRELLMGFQRSVEALKNKAIEDVQNL